MDLVKLSEHIAKFFKAMYQLLENIKAWASESADALKA